MTKNFVVYKSSAGSGKTFTLVKAYLKLALSDDAPRPLAYKKILAITFTNKAAAEMKLRIIEALKQISENTDKGKLLIDLLCVEIGISADVLQKRARLTLSEVLHNYSDFSVSTIDSFTHKIVKTFAFDLKLPVNFSIETNTAEFYKKVVMALMSKIGESAELTELLIQYSSNNARDNTAWDPELKLLEFAEIIQKENAEANLLKLKDYSKDQLKEIQKKLFVFTSGFKNHLKQKGEEALKLIKSKNLNDNHFNYTITGPQNVFRKWTYFDFKDIDELIGARLRDTVARNKWNNNKNSASENSALESITPRLNTIAAETIQYIKENIQRYSLFNLLEKNIYSIILVNELQQISEEFRTEEQIVFISEFNSKISKIVSEEPAPFIYERLGERYTNYLLDEFQDTSTLQWLNLLPLVDNSLANGRFNLIVGDGKQSIYRWRNANVQQFNALPKLQGSEDHEILTEREQNLEQNFKAEVLDTNYRSLKEVVEFNNDVFDFLPQHYLTDSFKNIYDQQTQKFKHPSGGYVSVHYGTLEKENLDNDNFALIKKHIGNALTNGYSYNDICIIVRNNRQGNLCANFLMEENIPVISSDSLLLKSNAEINCVISFLTFLNNPADYVSASAVINYISVHKHVSENIKELTASGNLFAVLKKLNIDLNPYSFNQKNVFDVCVEIITKLSLEKKSPQYIRFFLDEVNDYLVNKTGSVNDFLYWWDKRQYQASLIIPDGVNAVRVMTVHKSKGLEFPVVIIPFTNWDVYKANPAWVDLSETESPLPVGLFNLTQAMADAGLNDVYELEKNEQHLDNLNLLYVAFTRAIERLHVIAYKSKTQKKDTVADWLNVYLTNNASNSDEVYELGKLENKLLPNRKEQATSFDISNLSFNTNAGLIKIKGSHKLKLQDDTETALEKGIKMHYILSEINSASEIESVLENMLKQGIISSDEKPDLELKIKQILGNKLIQNYFTGNIKTKNEAEIITDTGELLRPDKIVFEKDLAIVIDYKTGKPDTKKYAAQMSKYAMALQKMRYTTIKKVIIYVDHNQVEEVV
ncbi:MAG TPA: UvrD-helicase domain-containing protein [Bacteroidia bacterium]|nr:UvrD-helicase domain-containing protein [Bacteroidia bacterium]